MATLASPEARLNKLIRKYALDGNVTIISPEDGTAAHALVCVGGSGTDIDRLGSFVSKVAEKGWPLEYDFIFTIDDLESM